MTRRSPLCCNARCSTGRLRHCPLPSSNGPGILAAQWFHGWLTQEVSRRRVDKLFFREQYARAALLSQAFQRMRRRKPITMELGSMEPLARHSKGPAEHLEDSYLSAHCGSRLRRLRVRVDSPYNGAGTVNNTACVDMPGDPVAANNCSTAPKTVGTPPLDPSAIPTLSEWALIILSMMMAALALHQMGPNARRRR